MSQAGQFFRNIWGSNSSKGFRLASWGVALGAFGAWYYYDNYYIKSRYPVPIHYDRKKDNN
eukprot:scaffold4368_cov180-Ochromonas_danica.AAC.3